MAVVDVINCSGEKISQAQLPDEIFGVPVKSSVLHEVVRMQLANKRSGTASVKHRHDVQGSTRKLFRQKGTGRARRGDIKSPLLRGGGVVFGPDNRSYKTKLPKKVRKLALKMALSAKLKENNLLVLDKFELDDIKTKKFLSVIKAIDVKNGLFVTSEKNEKLELSARNVPKMKILRAEGLNVYDVLKYDRLVLMESTLSGIEERLRS